MGYKDISDISDFTLIANVCYKQYLVIVMMMPIKDVDDKQSGKVNIYEQFGFFYIIAYYDDEKSLQRWAV